MAVIRKSSFLALFFTAVFAGTVHADQDVMKVKVPFPFLVRGEVLPAGEYDIKTDDAGTVVWIRGETRHAPSAVVLTTLADETYSESGHPALIFTRYENQYRLSEIREYGMTRKAEN
jgi:hypothetical protein